MTQGAEFLRYDPARFSIRAENLDDAKLLMESIGRRTPRLAGIIHLCSLDAITTEELTSETLASAANLGCVGALQLLQALSATDGLVVDGVWFVTRSAQAVDGGAAAIQVAQSPLWGLGRVAISEYQNLNCRLLDLATGSQAEIESFVRELDAPVEFGG